MIIWVFLKESRPCLQPSGSQILPLVVVVYNNSKFYISLTMRAEILTGSHHYQDLTIVKPLFVIIHHY